MTPTLHHQQQQLAALLAAALPKDGSSKITAVSSPAAASPPSEQNESSRLSAITSLHRAILYPPNALLVSQSASYLAQGLFQLVTDKLRSVRHAAATAYAALCSVLCSLSIASNGRQNHIMLGSLVDGFIAWSLPSLNNVADGSSELALESLNEFLNVGEMVSVERYALPILKACQEFLEDERMPLSLMPKILGVLTLISLKFFRSFQPHFKDIVDLLLGWALVPDSMESDKHVIMDSFLQFQKHWVNYLQFSLGLLSKFLDDMDMLLQDGSVGSPQQFKRLLALLSCFCTVLQSVASGLLEINFLEKISEPLTQMVPVILRCLSMIGRKFGWSKWIEHSWRCLTLLAEILSERFSTFYPMVVDILFQSLEVANKSQIPTDKISSSQVHGVLRTNLQLLSLQKLGLMPSSVDQILCFDKPISQLRLHPSHLVTGSAAATYIFLLQHSKNDVVDKAIKSLFEELKMLKYILGKNSGAGNELELMPISNTLSKSELVALIVFNTKVLLSSVGLGRDGLLTSQVNDDDLYASRAEMLATFLTENFNPFILPIKCSLKLQVTLLKLLEKLSMIDFMRKCPIRKHNSGISSETSSGISMEEKNVRNLYPAMIISHLSRYTQFIIRALDIYSPLAVKLEALEWMRKFCQYVIDLFENVKAPLYPCQAVSCSKIIQDMLFLVLVAASDREPEVRAFVATVLPMLFRAKLIHPMHFSHIAQIILERLGDPDTDIKNTYLKLLSDVLPLSVYMCGLFDCGSVYSCQPQLAALDNRSLLHWKEIFALKQLPQRLHSQQLVSILSYISQRWKVPLSSWIQRLILTCRTNAQSLSTQLDEAQTVDASGLWWDIKVEEDILERSCSVNHLAGSWWAVHEAARFCITTRLRTNLGGPTQTFAALERMLLDISHVLQLETEQNDGALNLIGSYAHLLPMRLLLEFVEALRKNVYNAYEGSIILPHASKTSSLFFRANKKVCEEWFSRITEPMMDAGLALQCNHATIQYCALRLLEIHNIVASAPSEKSTVQSHENLQNIGKYRGDILRGVWKLALALCKNHESEALVGLQKWAMLVFSPLLSSENHGPTDDISWGHFSLITGLAYQAKGQYENAAAYFIDLLNTEESLASMSSGGIQFAVACIIECYTAISDWKSLESWLLELQALRAKYAGKGFSGALTTAGNEINSIQALASFDEGDFEAARSYLDLTPKSSSELTLDPRLALQRSEQMLLQAMLLRAEGNVDKVPHELQKAQLMLEEAFSVLPLDGLVEAAPHVNQLYCISAFEGVCKLGDSLTESFQSLLTMYIHNIQFPCNLDHQDCNMWLKVLRICQNTIPTTPMTLEFCKNLIILARKQRNLMLATRLNNYLKGRAFLCSDESLRDYFISTSEYENALVLRVEKKTEAAYKRLWSFVHPLIDSCSTVACNFQENALKSKACLKFSNWLLEDSKSEKLDSIVLEIQEEFMGCKNSSAGKEPISLDGNQGSDSRISLIIEELVSTARKTSTLLCPMMGKSWVLYASWCYTQATASKSPCRKTAFQCSPSPIHVPEIHAERFTLNEEEKLRVKDIVSRLFSGRCDNRESRDGSGNSNISVTECECPYSGNELKPLWQPIVDAIETAAGAPDRKDCSSNYLLTKLSSEFKRCLASAYCTIGEAELASSVADLVDVCWSLRRRRLSLFGQAAQAFLNYLSSSSLKSFDGQLTGCNVDSRFKNVNYTLKSTLYVLHILVNYGVELKDTLEPALLKAPLLPWQDITPQLFAQLSSHPEKLVRKQLETLLIMLAKLSPWSLIYPTLVDANSPEKEPSEELQKILAYLKGLYPRLVEDAQLMIKELENVTVLWEELWLGTLQDLHADVMRRINLLKEEAARIAENTTLTQGEKNKINAAKYTAMMAPIVVVLERRLISTSRIPETPHELWFLEEYKEKIDLAITKFKTPPPSVTALGDVWRQFESIATSLASYQRKPSVSLGEVAPRLASLLSSSVPMPGLEKQIILSESESESDSLHQQIVTIASFSEQVAILPTKTKPKKLVVVGSDGLRYTYLLKGREDLRLDARIMQLLQSVNGFLQSSSATRKQSVAIRSYSVTPISGRAGLIQWVDNSISIYSVFKSWQKRTQLQQLSALGQDISNAAPPVPRPSDMFYGKIIPALKEKGIRKVISRRDWPHDVKRKVLLDLMNETPKQLLYQELWCASEGFKGLSLKLKRFSGSVAAMSMVGHILGLGDRHLDNILVDFFSGDIVHIDYNVCFDKGQRLKIPEIVPFRLTQTIEAAIGLTGIEGPFRANCESVLGALRKNKDIILMLLEVFVWDPLVEWTRANFHDDAAVVGEERKGMELAVSLSLFASRAQEIRVSLQEHHDLLLSTLPAVEAAMERFVSILNQYEIVSSHFHRADQERSNLIQYEASARSVVAEATCNSEQSGTLFDIEVREFTQAQAVLMEKAREAVTWIDQHGRILDALRSSSIPELKSLIELTGSEEALSLTSAVTDAGVPWTIVPEPTQIQCHDIDGEVSHSVAELARGLASAIAAMQIYSLAMQRILPLNYITTSPLHAWAQILLSLKNLSSEAISIARQKATELVNSGHIDRIDSPRINYDDLCLKLTNYSADILRMEEEGSALEMSIRSETESEAKEHFVSAFMNYMHHAGLKMHEESFGSGPTVMNNEVHMDFEEKREHFPTLLGTAVSNLFSDVKIRTKKSLDHCDEQIKSSISSQSALEAFLIEFEEQIEKCVFVTDFLAEQKLLAGFNIYDTETDANNSNCISQASWASIFRTSIRVCKNLIGNVTDVIVPILMKSVISFNSDVMDIFGSISNIWGLVDTALERLTQVELERDYLVEFESNYFVKVGLITEQQLALEEETVKGRDLLSWEEAEELASQEEACRVQLDRLHQTWDQKDLQTSSLEKTETDINDSLVEAELQLQSLITTEPEVESLMERKALVAALFDSFSNLELLDQTLMSSFNPSPALSISITDTINSKNSGHSLSEYIWNFAGLQNSRAFFIWKVFLVDLLLESCLHDVAASLDQNLGHDQLVDILKKKLKGQFQEHIFMYLKNRVAPIFLAILDRKIKILKGRTGSIKDPATDQDYGAARRLQLMLEEYCNVHETFKAARSAAIIMKRQVDELKDAFLKTSLEIAKMEWMQNITSRPLEITRLITHKFLPNDNHLLPVILNTNRPKLLEGMRSSISIIARALECLNSCDGSSAAAEGQLERALGWACGDSNPSFPVNVQARISGIPLEFHDHLIKRRNLLQEVRKNASDIMEICISISEFEASRDGIIRGIGDSGTWHESYQNAITKLDVTYHSFARAEKEWRRAQFNMEAASNGLVTATNELSMASLKAKSASVNFQSTLVDMRDSAYEASVALSSYVGMVRGHTALTSECGSILEEVLAITEGLHDVHSLGKEAAFVHASLIEDLSKANMVLIPLESLLSKDVAAMTDAMTREKEIKSEIAPIHGQAIFQSYYSRLNEALHVFKPLVPSLTSHVQELFSLLTRLARAAGLHAGNLHKALEGVGENLQGRSEEIEPLSADLTVSSAEYDDTQKGEMLMSTHGKKDGGAFSPSEMPLSDSEWISPPFSLSSDVSASYGAESAEASIQEAVDVLDETSQTSGSCRSQDAEGDGHEMPDMLSDYEIKQESSSIHPVQNGAEPLLDKVKDEGELPRTSFTAIEPVSQEQIGKNAYAISVLRRVEMKLDGRDITDNREISVAEQVDFLLRQATDINNLCNMYEGWTPWI